MKKTVFTIMILASLGLTNAHAIPYVSQHLYGEGTTGVMFGNGGITTQDTWTWDLTSPLTSPMPFVPGTPITSAEVFFRLSDTNSSNDFRIFLEEELLSTVSGFNQTFELTSGVSGTLLGGLSATGMMDYTITFDGNPNAVGHRFWLNEAKLTANTATATNGNPVPDGGATLALLGLGLAGIASVRRKLAK